MILQEVTAFLEAHVIFLQQVKFMVHMQKFTMLNGFSFLTKSYIKLVRNGIMVGPA